MARERQSVLIRKCKDILCEKIKVQQEKAVF